MFSKVIEKALNKQEKYVIRVKFNKWMSLFQKEKDTVIQEYWKEIGEKDSKIEELQKMNISLNEDISRIYEDKAHKRKLVGAAMIFSSISNKIIEKNILKNSFETWKADCEVNKIMENAFNKVLEINHKHVNARVTSAVGLLTNIFSKPVRNSFSELYLFGGEMITSVNRSPTPKFTHSPIMNVDENSSASLHDSTLFLTRLQSKNSTFKAKRRNNKSMDRLMF